MGKKYPKFFTVLVLGYNFVFISCVKIGITHWNDISGQIDSFEVATNRTVVRGTYTNRAPSPCPNRAEAVFKCLGGLRSIAHWLNDSTYYEQQQVLPENVLKLSSGNLIGGESGWISSIDGAWEKYGELVKRHFKPHVTSLGLKEFGAGLDRTLDYAHSLGLGTVTLANTCYQNQSSEYGKDEDDFCENYNVHQKIRILTVLDPLKFVQLKVGVIGFVNPFVERRSLPGKLKFTSVVASLDEVVSRYNNQVNLFIALGDGNLQLAKKILSKLPLVKLVVYSTGFLETNDANTKARRAVEYPVKYKQGFIATAGRYGSSVGNLVFELDADTEKLELVGGKLVETSRPEIWNAAAQAAQTDYTRLEAQIRRLKDDKVGRSRVHLQGGQVCWRQECNLGNLVADAMVHCALQLPSRPLDFPVHAIWHAGALFEDDIPAGSNINRFDIHRWLPFHNRAHLVRVKGRNLHALFEASAQEAMKGPSGQFLQISNGLEVYYDRNGGTVSRVRMTHDLQGIPQLSEINLNADYFLVIPTFLYEGRGVYDFAGKQGFWKDVVLDNVTQSNFAYDDDCVEGYVRSLGQVSVGFEERIWIDGDSSGRTADALTSTGYTAKVVIFTLFIFAAIQATVIVIYLVYVNPAMRRRLSRTPTRNILETTS